MSTAGWRYYNHAMIPDLPPHKKVDLTSIESREIWKNTEGKRPLFARWTSNFDCGYETNWWYCIKDEPLDILKLNSNYRYKINKGCKLFNVKKINPIEYIDALYDVFIEAFSSWPDKYRPEFNYDDAINLFKKLSNDPTMVCYGAFYKKNNELCGFMQVPTYNSYVELQVQRVKPSYEKYQINAALIYKVLSDCKEKLDKGAYVCDGERNILHETHFQDYLEKYFGFRKAYCKLNIDYNPKIKWIVKLIYPLRKIFYKFDNNKLFHNINGVMKMEEIIRQDKKEGKYYD